MNIYCGNLSSSTSEDGLRQLFEQFGSVHYVKIITDRDSGLSRGFGFVKMNRHEAEAAIEQLNGTLFEGNLLKINEARDRRPSGNTSQQQDSQFRNRRFN